MLSLFQKNPVAEYEADGQIERVYHEIKQTLRVAGVNLIFRSWAMHAEFLPRMWDAILPNVQTRAFEDAGDRVRSEAAAAAERLGRLQPASQTPLGESQLHQLRAALGMYHYINPKLLVIAALVRHALSGEQRISSGVGAPSTELIERGVPAKIAAMEMESEDTDDPRLQEIFADIKQTLGLAHVNSDYRTMALWPPYLEAAWRGLRPIVQKDVYRQFAEQLRDTARETARGLPHPVLLDRKQLEQAGVDVDKISEMTGRFEELLPGLILNIALLEHEWHSGADLARSPFPPAAHGRERGERI